MIDRLAKFNELVPSSLPFVEGRLEGHKERKNYTIIGRGVAEDTKQLIKIQSLHGYNLGAVSAMPKNGSGLHSHTTAEVFVIYSGKWRFYWGSEGKDETILNPGDIISMPTNMFRAFENAGDEEGLIFVVLGGDDPGIVTWIPEVLERAKKTGMAIEYKEKRLDKAEYLINKPSDISDTVLYKPDEITLINEKWRNHAIVINRLNGNYISTSNAMNKSGKCKSITEQEFLKEQDHLIRMVDAIGQAEAKFAKQNRKF